MMLMLMMHCCAFRRSERWVSLQRGLESLLFLNNPDFQPGRFQCWRGWNCRVAPTNRKHRNKHLNATCCDWEWMDILWAGLNSCAIMNQSTVLTEKQFSGFSLKAVRVNSIQAGGSKLYVHDWDPSKKHDSDVKPKYPRWEWVEDSSNGQPIHLLDQSRVSLSCSGV